MAGFEYMLSLILGPEGTSQVRPAVSSVASSALPAKAPTETTSVQQSPPDADLPGSSGASQNDADDDGSHADQQAS